MPVGRQVGGIGLHYLLFLVTVLVLHPGVGLAQAQTQTQPEVAVKTILVLHSVESNVPVFLETDKGVSETL